MIKATARGQPLNDECNAARVITNVINYCSANAEFTNAGATASFADSGNDVWFEFTARAYDVNISVSGSSSGGGTLASPVIGLYSNCTGTGLVGSMLFSNNVTTFYKGGLNIGQQYYIQVSGTGSNTGTFKLCINNYNPILRAGQDYSTASLLCNKESFTQTDVTGAGLNNNESAGTCLDNIPGVANEANTAWYKWVAANNGTLAFTITPTANDDIDWVLYDLGTEAVPVAISGTSAIRCAASRGIDCPELFVKTGLNMGSSDLTESGGCGSEKDGFVRFIDMQQGHIYALLVNNFSSGNNGFSVDFDGTGEFLGPTSSLEMQVLNECSSSQRFLFTSNSANYSSLKWTFGSGADIAEASGEGPYSISYLSPGLKTVVLQAIGDKGCFTVASKTFSVGITPQQPLVTQNKADFCIKDTIKLRTPEIPGLTYLWTGPAGFTSNTASADIPVKDFDAAGEYILSISSGDCFAAPVSVIIPPLLLNPTAAFHSVPGLPAKLSWPVTITFFNDSKDADTYLWDFGDGNTSTEPDPMHTYSNAGDYDVTLTAFKSTVCSASVMKGKFVIRAIGTLFIPNTFTPNGDNINDEFVVTVTNLLSYHLRIFNRWGDMLFETNSIFGNWNGTHNGNPVPMGTYYYVIDGTDLNGSKIKESGSVTVIR